jgi:hypothetical protein
MCLLSKLITQKSEKHLYKYHQNLLCIRFRWTQNVIVLWTHGHQKGFDKISNLQSIAMPVHPGNPKYLGSINSNGMLTILDLLDEQTHKRGNYLELEKISASK